MKKGQGDFIFLIVIAFLMVIVFMVIYQFISVLTTSNFVDPATEETATEIRQDIDNSKELLDALFILFYFGTIFGVGVAAFRLRTQSLFLLGLWLLITVLIFVASRFSDSFTNLTSSGLFQTLSSNFVLSSFIMSHLAMIYWLSSTFIIAIMFGIGRTSEA